MTRWSEILEGALFPAVPVPFNESKPDFQAQEKYASWMATQDIDGVAVWSHIGRGLHLDKTTRAEVLKCWKKALGAGRKIIAGVGPSLDSSRDSFISSAMKMAEDAEDADFLLVFPPSGFIEQSNPDGMIVNYHKELAKSGKPLILFYLSPRIGGMEYATDVLDEL
ncbi:MAG TPA: dihydrodipicolinate synthase family protein, partial [Firmicutes bacterium]|nr:dihydrodipicolinate synthase family protein [Bacillota bacterium]